MYIPKHHAQPDTATLHALMRASPLATWIVPAAGGLLVNHIPFVLDSSRGENGVLLGHVARANPVWRSLAHGESVAVFHGPQAYISPSWYPGKAEHGRAVPTWNYAVVHARGPARAIEDREWLLQQVGRLTDEQEAGRAGQWKVSDAPPDYIERLIRGIVGIEIPITELVGKWKVSQNQPVVNKLGVIAGLAERGDTQSLEMAALVDHCAPQVE